MYQQTDKFRARLKKKIRKEFNYWFALSFDELNAIKVKRELVALYDRLLEFNEKEYLKIIHEARLFVLQYLTKKEKSQLSEHERTLKEYLELVLTGYNHTTKYLYYPETERKRLRLAEEILTAKEYHDHKMYNAAVKKAADLWYTQSYQYAIDLEDAVEEEMDREAGIKKVKWMAEHDERTCHTCHKLDGQIFDIDNIPQKPHYLCRCWIVPYRGTD